MSMQQALGVVGFVVGSYFGYPQLGFVVGSLVGAALTPKEKIEGPKLDDLKVQVSTYGAGIPVLYGTERIGGNVIWSTDKMEREFTEEQGGKGGGVEATSYKYFVNMRQLLCETPRDGSEVQIVKMFMDGKIIWDASSGIPIGSALASAENPNTNFVVYQGEATQLPNPEEEAYEGGPGSVPAYRGVVSVYMKDVECPGERVPQFSFVLSTTATDEVEVSELVTVDPLANQLYMGWVGSNGVWHWQQRPHGFGDPYYVDVFFAASGHVQPVKLFQFEDVVHQQLYPVVGNSPRMMFAYAGVIDSQAAILLDVVDIESGLRTNIYGEIGADAIGYSNGRAAARGSDPVYALASYEVSTDVLLISPANWITCEPVTSNPGLLCFIGDVLHIISDNGSTLYHAMRDESGVAVYTETIGPTLTSVDLLKSAIYSDGSDLYAYILHNSGGSANIYKITPSGPVSSGSWELLCNVPGATTANISNGAACTFWCSDQMAVYGPIPTEDAYNSVRFHAISTDEYKVSDIIADQCERSNETRYDVSTIPDSDTVVGYKLANPASARANVDPLMLAFQIFIVDEDGLIKFKKYEDIESEAYIDYEELGQAETGADPSDAMPLSRAQEIDMPRSVAVGYIEPAKDYQTATEKEIRQVTEATEDVVVELPVAINSDIARKATQTILYNRWRSQNTRSLKVSRKFSFLSPGDGATVEYPRGTEALWRVMSMNDDGLMLELNVEPGDAELFTQTATGFTGYTGQEVAPLPPPTRMVLMDIPILRDQDDNVGLYVAAEGFGTGWRGYTLWVGDDDSDLQDRGTVTSSVPIGFSESALGAWTSNVLDTKNSIIVNMGDDVLNSTTSDLLFTTRVNLAFIGADDRWEAIQFQTASALGSGRFVIYGLLRGLYGTERFNGTHQSGDTFVLMREAGMLRPTQDAGSLGQDKSYRPVTLGRSVNSVQSVRFANEGVGNLPYSPWDARKSKASSNDQTITWQRRSRLTTNSLRGIIPLGEAAELYQIDFYTSSAFTTLAGTLTSTSKSVTITSAQQTSFGLTPGGTLYVHISQVSDIVGAGTPLEATL